MASGAVLIFAAPSKITGRAKADLAQLVEQLIRNEQVVGSSPIIGSKAKAPKARKHFRGFCFTDTLQRQLSCP